MPTQAYYYIFASNITWAIAAVFFAHYADKISSRWMNCFKGLVALTAFAIHNVLINQWHPIGAPYLMTFFISGILGLGFSDMFMLYAFSKLGAARAMMLTSFSPLLMGLGGHFFFGQQFDSHKLVAILLFVLCSFIFSLESYKKHGKWNGIAICAALLNMVFNLAGVFITRYTFDHVPEITAAEGCFYRYIGALSFILIYSYFFPVKLVSHFKKLSMKNKIAITIASLLGAYLGLVFYLEAIKIGNLATISSMGISCIIFATIIEFCVAKKLPSKYFVCGMVVFLIATKLIVS